MNIEWREAPSKRGAVYGDHNGRRLHIQRMPRGRFAPDHFRVRIDGIRLGEFDDFAQAQAAAIRAA